MLTAKTKKIIIFCKISAKKFGSLKKMLYLCDTNKNKMNMELECTCTEINLEKWNDLMKGSKPINYNWLKNKIRKHLPDIYNGLCLNFSNPYGEQSRVTKTHYILVHSAIEYFIRK